MGIVRDFESAFNRQDVDALVALFAPTATYTDTFYGDHRGHLEGHARQIEKNVALWKAARAR